VIAQYVDDTSLTLLGEDDSVLAMISMLDIFYVGLGLVLDWNKLLQENGLGCNWKRMIGCSKQLKNDLGSLIAPTL